MNFWKKSHIINILLYLKTLLAVDQTFGIQCPASLLKTPDVVTAVDFEGCVYTTNNLNDNVFCGKCSLAVSGLKWIYYTSTPKKLNFQYVKFILDNLKYFSLILF